MTTVAVVLAAGKGTRMRSAIPKVLHPLGGLPLLGHVMKTARTVADRLVVVVSPGADAVRDVAAADDVVFVDQMEQLGTGHAVSCALAEIDHADRIVVLYGDVPLLRPETLARLVKDVPAGALGIVTAEVADPFGFGRMVRDETGRVCRIVEEKDASSAERAIREINSGIYAIPGSRIADWIGTLNNENAQGEYYLTDIVAMAAKEGVSVETVIAAGEEEVAGINDRVQLAVLERALQARRAEALMRAGVTLADPARVDVRGTLEVGPDSSIDIDCVFEGDVRLGAGVRIAAHCVIKNAVIGDGVEIEAFTHIEGAHVGASARVGPYARLREGTELGARTKIGNFVETKQTRLGEGSKANHLAYLGNATVGADSNIGAGTITCNYDGVTKHPTVIGDGAFVGSNSTLVAPVELGKGAYVGAGSSVTKKVPDGTLAVGRAKQRNIEGWRSPKARLSDDD